MPALYIFKANSMHFLSYNVLYDPLSLFQFQLNFINIWPLDIALNKHIHNETHYRPRYIPAPYIPLLYSCKASIMHFLSYNVLYDPLSLFQCQLNFINIWPLDIALNKQSQNEAHDLLRYIPAPYIPPL